MQLQQKCNSIFPTLLHSNASALSQDEISMLGAHFRCPDRGLSQFGRPSPSSRLRLRTIAATGDKDSKGGKAAPDGPGKADFSAYWSLKIREFFDSRKRCQAGIRGVHACTQECGGTRVLIILAFTRMLIFMLHGWADEPCGMDVSLTFMHAHPHAGLWKTWSGRACQSQRL